MSYAKSCVWFVSRGTACFCSAPEPKAGGFCVQSVSRAGGRLMLGSREVDGARSESFLAKRKINRPRDGGTCRLNRALRAACAIPPLAAVPPHLHAPGQAPRRLDCPAPCSSKPAATATMFSAKTPQRSPNKWKFNLCCICLGACSKGCSRSCPSLILIKRL